MRSTPKLSTRLALTSVLSVALCASIGLAQARAQGKMKKDKMQTGKMMDRTSEMSGDDYDEMGIPVAPSYPNAAPGSVHMNHWTDFTRKHMMSGSATETMMDKRSEKMGKRMDHMEDPDELMPVAPSYPNSAPGSLDLNHWSDYTRKRMMPGSASETAMDKMHTKGMANATNMMHDEDEDDLLPTAPSYPWAAPGTLDLNHWTDLTQKHMSGGSASEARMEKMEKKREKMRTKK